MTPRWDAKRCTSCGAAQTLDAFDRNPARRDGHVSQCKDCRRRRQRAQGHPWARRRAQRWLAHQHPGRWAERYQTRKTEARAELPGQARRAQSRAWSRALADLQAEFPGEYAARYPTELIRYQQQHGSVQPLADLPADKLDRRVLTLARARALDALARRYPDQADRLVHAALARLPAGSPAQARELARLRALDGLRRAHPKEFQARYAAELARPAALASVDKWTT